MPVNTLKGLKLQSEIAISLFKNPKDKLLKKKLSEAHALIDPSKINILEDYRVFANLESYVDINECEFQNWLKG